MTDDIRSYNQAVQDNSVFEKVRNSAFESANWTKVRNQRGMRRDKQLIIKMTNFSEQGRPLPEDLIENDK